jgi:hypothetical protein
MTAAQRFQCETQQKFTVSAPSGRQYVVSCYSARGNITALDPDGVPAATLCGHITLELGAHLPDHLLAQMLTLQFDEPLFLRSARVTREFRR